MKRVHVSIAIFAGFLLVQCASVAAQNDAQRTKESSRAERWIESVDERITALQRQCEQLAAANSRLRGDMGSLAADLAFVAGELGEARKELTAVIDADPAEQRRLATVSDRLAAIQSRLLKLNARFVNVDASDPPSPAQDDGATGGTTTRPLAAVITAPGGRDAFSHAARTLVDNASDGRIATRIYLSRHVDPTRTFTFNEASMRSHIAQRAPSRQEGCLFVVDLEGEYFKALRSGDPDQEEKAVELYLQAVRATKEARPGEPVIVYGIPNRVWDRYDLSMFDPVFAEVDYVNVNAYAGNDTTAERYRDRIDRNFAASKEIADQFGLDYVAHVNPRYKDNTRVPIDEFIEGMEYLKAKGVNHVVYWQPPWQRVPDLAADGKPITMSDEAWQAAVEQCYICALLKVFDREDPVSRACSTTLPGEPN